MPYTMKQLTKRYGPITERRDKSAPDFIERKKLEEKLATIAADLDKLRLELKRRRVRFVSGMRGNASGIVVGEGDTKAEALADAGRRVGRD